MQPAAMMMLRSARGQLLSEAQQQRRLEDSQCQPACCAVGHTYYGATFSHPHSHMRGVPRTRPNSLLFIRSRAIRCSVLVLAAAAAVVFSFCPGYGDYSRLGNCNCVTTAAVLCGNMNIDTLQADVEAQQRQQKQQRQRQRRHEDSLVEQQ
jgi:hypothetical protein